MAAAAQPDATFLSGIYAIVDSPALARVAVDAGIRIVQYRAKDAFNEDDARAIRAVTRGRALFIVNDRWREAARYDADGVHVGPDDVPFEVLPQVRAHIGTQLLGVSCASAEEAKQAVAAGASYIGVGSVFATPSKHDAGEPIGIERLERVVKSTSVPVAAIGGITLRDIDAVKRTGAAMAAVIGAISGASDPAVAAAQLVRAWSNA